MSLILSALATLATQPSPQFHNLPPSSLADLAKEQPGPLGLTGGNRTPCTASQDPDEIIVCGDLDGESQRIGPSEPEPGDRQRLIAGEPPSAAAALGADACFRLCHQPVQVDVIGVARALRRGIGRLLDPDS
jgi:hypothetical protein